MIKLPTSKNGLDQATIDQKLLKITTAFIDINHINADGTGLGTDVVFFSTNSTGQLAFLDNMVG
jgi:hypothetical protein